MSEGFKSLGELFKNNPVFGRLREIVRENDLVEDFIEIFPDFKNIIAEVKVDKKILKLKIDNAAWRSELKFRETEIIDKINDHYKEKRVNHIRFIS